MKIHSHKVSLTPDELETLGSSLELYLEREISLFKENSEGFLEQEINLMRNFVECGYTLYMDEDTDIFENRLTIDVDKWIKHKIEKQKVVE